MYKTWAEQEMGHYSKEYKEIIVKQLDNYFEEYSKDAKYNKTLWDSMRYTTLLDGKRLRAIMCIEAAKSFGASMEDALPAACAMEIMHAYSLIHDDLPCMDNDDLRRGKPSNHKVFGEAIAVLAGDSLISFGAQLIIDKTKKSPEIVLDIVSDYLKCAGAIGITSGQCADIEAETKEIDIENLEYIHKYKTGALFNCAIITGAKIAGVKNTEKLSEFAFNFGTLFQIYDDIIDATLTTAELGKTANKDENVKKLTYVTAWGLDKTRDIFKNEVIKNRILLKDSGLNRNVFEDIYNMMLEKTGVGIGRV